MATNITSRVVVPLSYIQGNIQSSFLNGGITLIPNITAQVHSLAVTGAITVTLHNTRPADWPDTGDVSAWEIHSEQFVSAPGLNVTIPALSFHGTGQDSASGILSVTLPSLMAELSGSDTTLGTLDLVLPKILFSGRGILSAAGILNVGIPPLKISLATVPGVAGTLAVTIPALEWSASGNLSAEGVLAVTIPLLRVSFNTLADSYLNMVMNIQNFGLTTYDNYDFNSLCRFNGVNLGATAAGIFNLDSGLTDNGTLLDWNIRTPFLDLHQKVKKGISAAWLSYKSDGDLIMTVILPDATEYEYPVTGLDETEEGVRVKFGKGIRSKYLALDLRNDGGSSLSLDTWKLLFEKTDKAR